MMRLAVSSNGNISHAMAVATATAAAAAVYARAPATRGACATTSVSACSLTAGSVAWLRVPMAPSRAHERGQCA